MLLLAGVLVALPASSQAAACDMTVSYGHPVTAHRTATDTFTVCLVGAPGNAKPLLDVRATPADKSASSRKPQTPVSHSPLLAIGKKV